LKKTLKEGLTFSPTDSLDIDCSVDADFSRFWPHEFNRGLEEELVLLFSSKTGFSLVKHIADGH